MTRFLYDFESKGIEQRPKYPPEPVGLAFKLPRGPLTYAAWGHPTGNGIYQLAKGKLKKKEGDPRRVATLALKDGFKCDEVLGHNSSKFDVDLAETHMGVKAPPWHNQHDSLFSRFLADPYAPDFKLKNSAERVLGEKPEEQDAVFEWLADHGFVKRTRHRDGTTSYQKDAGAFICEAPGDLVAWYAIGDLTRSEDLWTHDMKRVRVEGMLEAYRREQRVAPILLACERTGIRCDVPRLDADLKLYESALLKVEAWLRKKIGKVENFDSDDEVAEALAKSKVVKRFPLTDKGLKLLRAGKVEEAKEYKSVSKSRLTKDFYSDPDIYVAMCYRNIAAYVLSQNIRPWVREGHIWTTWNQVRRSDGDGGAVSGRITCSKVGNIIKNPTGGKNPDYLVADDAKIRKLVCLPELPLARKYVLPDEGGLFVHRDWNQQEIRITAHYEDADLAKAYKDDPSVDIHKFCTDLINRASGQNYARDVIKHVNLRRFYGGGRDGLITHPMLRLDRKMGCDLDCRHERCDAWLAAGEIIRNWDVGLPGVVSLQNRCKAMFQRGEPIRTIGGRVYHCKPAGYNEKQGRWTDYSYTGMNTLVQPSGADLLKMAMIAYDEHPKRRGRLLCTLYDEVNSSAPVKLAKQESVVLKECMHAVELDVPWKSDGDERPNWGEKAQ